MPKQSASVIVLNNDSSQVLLQLREDFRVWTIPGGSPEAKENLEQTAIRETLEETGAHVDLEAKLGEYRRPNMPSGDSIVHAFIARYKSGSLEDAGWEAADVQWFDVNELPKRLTPPYVTRIDSRCFGLFRATFYKNAIFTSAPSFSA